MTWILPRQLHTLASALDTEALSLDCTEQSEVCARSLFVRSKPSPLPTWLRKWKRDSWTQHLSGRILRPSLGQRFETEWTYLLEDTHASHSAAQASEPAKKIRGICGRGSQMEFDFSDPASASLRTSKDISAWGCPTSSKTWQEWVTERRGAYSARLKSAHRISVSESSSWPTISVNQSKNSVGGSQLGRNSIPLGTMVAMHGHPATASSSTDGSRPGLWQTATVSTGAHKQKDGSMIDKLDQQVKQWQTPKSQDSESGKKISGAPNLIGQAKQWATPIMGDSHLASTQEAAQKRIWEGKVTLSRQMAAQEKAWATPRTKDAEGWMMNQERALKGKPEDTLTGQATNRDKVSGKLNPRWVETLMGLPVGWTMPSCVSPVTIGPMSCDCSETELSRQQPSGPSGS